MNASRTHRQSRQRYGSSAAAPAGAPLYWGWSHANGRMEMMDLPSYLDSFRMGYEQAVQDLQQRFATMAPGYPMPGVPTAGSSMPGPAAPQAWGGWPGAVPTAPPQPGHHRRHRHGHHRDRDCGCEDCWERDRDDCECRDFECCEDEDCRCECCIGDADVVVYGRCGEVRLVPIEVCNDSRKVREDVTVEVSDVRSSGGRKLAWQVRLDKEGPLTLEPCSTTKLELLVHIACPETPTSTTDTGTTQTPTSPAAKSPKDAPPAPVASETNAGEAFRHLTTLRRGDVDDCEVGYVTIRLGGCIVRPIVVAIAVLPNHCGAYRTGCSCSCCC